LLKLYQETLIGYQETGASTFGMYGQDTLEVYQQHLKTQSSEWLYRQKEVNYNRNSYGHRSKEIDQLDREFILFVGCSITVGSAVSLEDSFPYIVSKQLSIDYYNLAVEGSGPDLLSFNISNWFKKINRIPTAVVIQWPEVTRTFRQNGTTIIPIGPWSCRQTIKNSITKQQWNDYENLILTDYFDHYCEILKNNILSLLTSHNIRIIDVKDVPVIDYGRDLKHPGIESHKLISNQILSEFKNPISFGQ
jgi:hypothetical protein